MHYKFNLMDLLSAYEVAKQRKFKPTCFNCAEEGHVASECKQPENRELRILNANLWRERLRKS